MSLIIAVFSSLVGNASNGTRKTHTLSNLSDINSVGIGDMNSASIGVFGWLI